MQTLRHSWLGIATLTFMFFSNPIFAIDNPDAPDLIAEFEVRERPFIIAIENPNNTSQDYAAAYTSYLKFLDKELNTVYPILRKKLPQAQQKHLKAAQISWIKHRDLEFAFIDKTWTNIDSGTSSSISRGQYKATVVRTRVIQLMHYAKTL